MAQSPNSKARAGSVLVETNSGRPTQVEGNPLHPASLGATDLFAQAAVLQLWDPACSQVLLHQGRVASWLQFVGTMQSHLTALDRTQGAGLSILTRTVQSCPVRQGSAGIGVQAIPPTLRQHVTRLPQSARRANGSVHVLWIL
jgi:hypothetical protein